MNKGRVCGLRAYPAGGRERKQSWDLSGCEKCWEAKYSKMLCFYQMRRKGFSEQVTWRQDVDRVREAAGQRPGE